MGGDAAPLVSFVAHIPSDSTYSWDAQKILGKMPRAVVAKEIEKGIKSTDQNTQFRFLETLNNTPALGIDFLPLLRKMQDNEPERYKRSRLAHLILKIQAEKALK